MTYLLDINVIIALLDPLHVHHEAATSWFAAVGRPSWATSPIIQNGVVRIIGSGGYVNVPFGCDAVADLLAEWCQDAGHQFWQEDLSLLDETVFHRRMLQSPKRITDTYLLALAARRGGKFATFDQRLSPAAVRGGREALHPIA